MRTYTEYLTVQTAERREIRAITEGVKAALKKSEFREGLALVGSLHANAGVLLGLSEPGFFADLTACLDRLAAPGEDYQLGRKFESSAATVLGAVLAGHQVSVAFSEGRLDLGPWQEILYLELDGQRPKRVVVKLLGE